MTINEIFPNPTVKQVTFQIRFPNLFYIENKIGEIQLKIMKEFPESSLLYRKQIVFADLGPDFKAEEITNLGPESTKKIWRFESKKKLQLNILSDSLDISSPYHKTYNLDGGGEKFRDILKFILDNFFGVTGIPIINRIGLRYTDECPVPSLENEPFKSYYNSAFPLDRFNLNSTQEMEFKTVIKKDDLFLRYIESLKIEKDKSALILDFDAFAINIPSEDCLSVTDRLHTAIAEEFKKTIKEPVYKYMRGEQES